VALPCRRSCHFMVHTGQDDTYMISVFDGQGNRMDTSVSINGVDGLQCAPQPFIDISRSAVNVGQSVTMDATQSVDPGGSSSAIWSSGISMAMARTTRVPPRAKLLLLRI